MAWVIDLRPPPTVVVQAPQQLWLPTVVAAVAALFSGTAAVVAWLNYSHTRDRARREQASAFAVWLTSGDSPTSARVFLHNGSPLPVFGVTIQIGSGDAQRRYSLDTVSPMREPAEDRGATSMVVEALTENLTAGVPDAKEIVRQVLGITGRGWRPHASLAIECEFRDAEGQQWRRDTNGVLTAKVAASSSRRRGGRT